MSLCFIISKEARAFCLQHMSYSKIDSRGNKAPNPAYIMLLSSCEWDLLLVSFFFFLFFVMEMLLPKQKNRPLLLSFTIRKNYTKWTPTLATDSNS